MVIHRSLIASGVLAGLCLVLSAIVPHAGAVPAGRPLGADMLTWKLKAKESFFQTVTTKSDQDMKVAQQNIKQAQELIFYLSYTPVKKDDRGNWSIKLKIEGIKLSIQLAGNTIAFDSTRGGNANNPLAQFLQNMVGGELDLTVSRNMEVSKIEGLSGLLKNGAPGNQAMVPNLMEMFGDAAFKQLAESTLGAVPGAAKKKGDSWTREAALNMGGIGGYKTSTIYTYRGKVTDNKGLGKIDIQPSLKYVGPNNNNNGGALPFKITEGELKSTAGRGTVFFDLTRGRLVRSTLEMKVEGKLKIGIGGMNTDVALSQTQTTTVEVSGKRWPWAMPKKGKD
jgi:hypothetical protein